MVLFVFQFYPVCNIEKFISFGPGTLKSERVKSNMKVNSLEKVILAF